MDSRNVEPFADLVQQKEELFDKDYSIMQIYTIIDLLADSSGPLFEAKNDAVAYRSYLQTISKAYNPSDYQLVRVGYVERITGKCIIVPEMELVLIDDKELVNTITGDMEVQNGKKRK